MKLYKLTVNGNDDIIHYKMPSIINRKNEVLKQWISGNNYGFSYWTDKPRPTFEIKEVK
jgi:flagellar assembly factor FliW